MYRKIATLVFGLVVFLSSLSLFATPAYAIQCGSVGKNGTDLDAFIGYTASGPYYMSASPFTPSQNCVVQSASMRVAKNPGRAEDLHLYIFTDNAGVPGSNLETGGTVPGTYSTYATYGWATSTFSGTLTLTSGTQYWIVASSTTIDNTNILLVSGSGGVGTCKNWGGSNWTAVNCTSANGNSLSFDIDGTVPAAATVVPNTFLFKVTGHLFKIVGNLIKIKGH